MNGSGEDELGDWLTEQIRSYDSGWLTQDQIDYLDENLPTWRDEDTRFSYRLYDHWTEDRMRGYLWPRILLYDAGLLAAPIVSALDSGMSDWRSDTTRIYCGLPPAQASN